MSEKISKFFELKYISKKPKRELLETFQISDIEYQEMVRACKQQKDERDNLYCLYKRKGFNNLSFSDFLQWYKEQDAKCYYCGVKQFEIEALIKHKLVFTKRLNTRGKRLELERILPNESYNNTSNIKFCCYWCNNAKSDEFSEVEFRKIAIKICKIWRERLNNIIEPFNLIQ